VERAPKARTPYDKIVEASGNKGQMWQEAGVVKAQAKALPVEPKRINTPQAAEAAVSPRSPVHERPMKLWQGVYSTFWSCSVRNLNG